MFYVDILWTIISVFVNELDSASDPDDDKIENIESNILSKNELETNSESLQPIFQLFLKNVWCQYF